MGPIKRLALLALLIPSLASAQAFRVGSGIQVVPRVAAPTRVATNGSVWINSGTSALQYTNAAGTTIALGASGASTLATAYTTGASQTDSTILLDNTRLGVRIRDNATPIGGTKLFSIETSTGTSFFNVSTAGSGTVTFNSLPRPSSDLGWDLGTSAYRWGNVYVANVSSGSGTALDLQISAPLGQFVRLRANGNNRLSVGEFSTTFTPAAATSGALVPWTFSGPLSTGLTASTEAIDFYVGLGRVLQHATGALTTQRAAVFDAPTYSFVGASTITNAATVAINAAPTAGTFATITNAYALWVQAGRARFDGGIDGSGYIGQSDQLGFATVATTSSTTFATIGNGTTSGFATWTTPSIVLAKTYMLSVNVDVYATAVAGNQQVIFQILVDGSAPGGQPSNAQRQPLELAEGVAPTTFIVPIALTTGTHTIDIQWKVSGASNTMNANQNCSLQYVLWG